MEQQLPSTAYSMVDGLQNGSRDAWRRFYDEYRPSILRRCLANGLQYSDAEEVAQEVLIAIAGGVHSFEHRHFRRWIARICTFKIVDFRRRASKQGDLPGDSVVTAKLQSARQEQTDSESVVQEERLQCLELMKAEFGEKVWLPVWMTVAERRSTKDVAQELGMNEGTIRQYRSRVLRRLRECFEGELPSD